MKKRAFYKDIKNTLKNNLSRFFAIVVMAALGTGVFTGFAAGCMDIFKSADRFYDNQNTYDIKIASTLGLTEKDISSISDVEGVSSVFGNCSLNVQLKQKDGNLLLANLTTLDTKGMNHPYLQEGTLPTKVGQIAVNTKFIEDTGLKIGDFITLSEEDTSEEGSTDTSAPALAVSEYEITGIILSPLNISNSDGGLVAASFSTNNNDYMLYTTKECIDSNIDTAIYITVADTSEMDCYSLEYQSRMDEMTSKIEDTILEERQQARYDEIVSEANAEIAVEEGKLTDKIIETDQKLSDAQKKIDEGRSSIVDGWVEVEANKVKLADGLKAVNDAQKSAADKFRAAQKEIDDNLEKLSSGEEELNIQEETSLKKFATYEKEINTNQEKLNLQKTETEKQLEDVVVTLSDDSAQLFHGDTVQQIWTDMITDGTIAAPYLLVMQTSETPTKDQTDSYQVATAQLQEDTKAFAGSFAAAGYTISEEQINTFSNLAVAIGTQNYSQTQLEESSAALATKKSKANKQIADSRQKIKEGKEQLTSGQNTLNDNIAKAELQFSSKKAEINDGLKKLEKAKSKLETSEADLVTGQAELDTNKADYQAKIADAKQKITEAKEDVVSIDMTKWYVWDRSENDSFTGLDNDVSFIEAVTKAFPIIFFLVAIMVCLTTMTRMVEEDRSLIGTYKSLGYSKFQISLKYIFYAALACVVGGILGNVIGFYVLPIVIKIIVSTMYVIPTFQLSFYPVYGLGGFAVFLIGIVGATVFSCVEMLHKRPAELMRPKAPKEGSRVILERIPFLWKRLNFLNKVTCRNLFRYKKRALMTIIGILGCMMLIVLGFGVRDTVGGLMSDQYDQVTVYDAIVVTDNLDTAKMKALANEFMDSGMVKEQLPLKITTLTLWSDKDNVDITVMVIPDGTDLEPYIHLRDTASNKKKSLTLKGIVVTKNAAKQLELESGDTASLHNEENKEYDFPVDFVTTNNAGNYVYISESAYQAAFADYSETSFLLNLTDKVKGQEWLDLLSQDDRILNLSSSQSARDTFSDVKKIVNMVVYLLISMAAVLALTVLFTLSNINISERERELATMKVLGFKQKEVSSYVNKETFILTLIGILLGMPAGYGITYAILSNVSIADTAFNVRVSAGAYLISAILTLAFGVIVNKITDRSLKKINMVEALKSVE